MKRKNIFVISIISIVLVLGGGILLYKYTNTYKDTPIEPVYSLIKILYFKEGNYADYKKLFENSQNILNEQQFEFCRKDKVKGKYFKYGSETTKAIPKHLETVSENGQIKIYYIREVNHNSNFNKETLPFWLVENKNGKWLINNN